MKKLHYYDKFHILWVLSLIIVILLLTHQACYSSINLYPNPVKKDAVLTIKTSNLNDNLECSLYDLTGRKISMQTTIDNTFVLSNQVPSGIYILFIKTKNRIFKEKIVVE